MTAVLFLGFSIFKKVFQIKGLQYPMFITIWFKNSRNSRGKGFTLFCFGYFR